MTRVVSRDVVCPTCGAQEGYPCTGSPTGPSRGRPVQSHYERVWKAKQVQAERAAPEGGAS